MPKTCVVWFSTQIITCHIIATSPHLWRIWATNTSTTFRNSKNKLQQSNVLSKLARYSEPPSSKRKKNLHSASFPISYLLYVLAHSVLNKEPQTWQSFTSSSQREKSYRELKGVSQASYTLPPPQKSSDSCEKKLMKNKWMIN